MGDLWRYFCSEITILWLFFALCIVHFWDMESEIVHMVVLELLYLQQNVPLLNSFLFFSEKRGIMKEFFCVNLWYFRIKQTCSLLFTQNSIRTKVNIDACSVGISFLRSGLLILELNQNARRNFFVKCSLRV